MPLRSVNSGAGLPRERLHGRERLAPGSVPKPSQAMAQGQGGRRPAGDHGAVGGSADSLLSMADFSLALLAPLVRREVLYRLQLRDAATAPVCGQEPSRRSVEDALGHGLRQSGIRAPSQFLALDRLTADLEAMCWISW